MKLHAQMIDKKQLTQREADMFELMCSGLQNKSISTALGISIKVVEKHIDHIYEKLGIRWQSVNKRSAALLIAIHNGMIKTVLHSIFAVLIFEMLLITDKDLIRPVSRITRVTHSRSKES